MANQADKDVIEATRKKLREHLDKKIREKAERPDDASAGQQEKDLAESILELNIVTTAERAMMQFFVQRGNCDPEPAAATELVVVELRLLKALISEIEPAVMTRVFNVALHLGSGETTEEPMGLLPTIRSRIVGHGFKLRLTTKDTPISVLTNKPADKLVILQGVTLESLVLDYDYANNKDNLKFVISYTDTRDQPLIPKVSLRLRGFGSTLAADNISVVGLVDAIPQMTSLQLNYNDGPASDQPSTFLSPAQLWRISSLKRLKHLEVIGRFRERNPDTMPMVNCLLPFLESLALENVHATRGFFSILPQLTTLRIQHSIIDQKEPSKKFSTAIIDEVAAAMTMKEHLEELETLIISGRDIETMGGSNVMRNLSKAIVDNYQLHCQKLQTLVLNFNYPVDGAGATILQLLNAKEPFLATAPLTVEIPRAVLKMQDPVRAKTPCPGQMLGAIVRLAHAVSSSGLQCLNLAWTVKHYAPEMQQYPIDRNQLLYILRRFEEMQQQLNVPMQGLKIKQLALDSDITDSDGNVETSRSIVWKNSKSRLMQRIELTHRGPLGTKPVPGSATTRGDGQVDKQPGATAAGGSDQGKQQPTSTSKA